MYRPGFGILFLDCWHGIVLLGLFVHFLFGIDRWVGGTNRGYGWALACVLPVLYIHLAWHGWHLYILP